MLTSSFLALVPSTVLLDVVVYLAGIVLVVFGLLGFASMLVGRDQAVASERKPNVRLAFEARRDTRPTARAIGKQPLAA